MQVMQVRPVHPDSYERLCHESHLGAFFFLFVTRENQIFAWKCQSRDWNERSG